MSLIFIIAIITVGWLLYHLYLKNLLKQGKSGQIKVAIVALGLVFLALAVTGRAPALFAILGALMTQVMRFAPLLIRFAPSLKRHFGSAAGGASSAGKSQVATATVVVSMEHATGNIDGEITDGQFAGRALSSLSINELAQLYQHCAENDPDACRLISAYATRHRSDEWQAGAHEGAQEHSQNRSVSSETTMGVDEARKVLGLDENATRKDITAAHRSLMGRFHPDKGGNDYLATKVNSARDVLLAALKRNT